MSFVLSPLVLSSSASRLLRDILAEAIALADRGVVALPFASVCVIKSGIAACCEPGDLGTPGERRSRLPRTPFGVAGPRCSWLATEVSTAKWGLCFRDCSCIALSLPISGCTRCLLPLLLARERLDRCGLLLLWNCFSSCSGISGAILLLRLAVAVALVGIKVRNCDPRQEKELESKTEQENKEFLVSRVQSCFGKNKSQEASTDARKCRRDERLRLWRSNRRKCATGVCLDNVGIPVHQNSDRKHEMLRGESACRVF